MSRKKKEGPRVNFQFNLYGEEAARWLEIRERARRRNPHISDSAINRFLVGLPAVPNAEISGEVTEQDRRFFLGVKNGRAAMVGRLQGKTHISEVAPKRNRK